MELLLWAATIMTIIALFEGLALKLLWGWYMVPIFSLPALSLVQATGIAIIIGLTTYHSNDLEKENSLMRLGQSIYCTLAYVAVGWILHFFM